MSLLDRLPLWFQTAIAAMVVLVVLAISSLTGASATPAWTPNLVNSAATCTASSVAIDAAVFQEQAHQAKPGAVNAGGAKSTDEPRPAAERSYFPAYSYAEKVSANDGVTRCGGGPRAPPSFFQ